MITVKVHLYSQREPITRCDVINTYTKDGMFCVYLSDLSVERYPVQHIFRVTEDGE